MMAAASLFLATAAHAQLDVWKAAEHFAYRIEKIGVQALPPTVPQAFSVKVVFAVIDPLNSDVPWDIKNALPFQTSPAQLTLDIGWDPGADFTNAGSNSGSLAVLTSTALGPAAALPVQVRSLTSKTLNTATPCTPADCGATGQNRYFVVATVRPLAFPAVPRYGRVVLEGRPVCNGVPGVSNCPSQASYPSLPARTGTANFTFAATAPLAAKLPDATDPRRSIVTIDKCKVCHDGKDHGTGIVPRLSLHGANRNENITACVVCHNPNQTDVAYRRPVAPGEDPRIAGPEVPIDFKVLVHSIHSGGFRSQPFVVIGFQSSVNDFSGVRFPKALRDCTNCHVDANGKGTFELPLRPGVLGTTIETRSAYLATSRTIDVDPSNDVKISPTAAVCSACHDSAEVKSHMVRTGGASFTTTQAAIGLTVRERCASCHGPGKEEDVRRAHEIGGAGEDVHTGGGDD